MMISRTLSREIYNELNNGRMINRRLFEQGTERDNPFYSEIAQNKPAYTEMYQNIGFELVHGDGYFFIRDDTAKDPHKDGAIKVAALLTLLGQITMQKGYRFSLLREEGTGLSQEMADEADKTEPCQDIKASVQLKNSLWQEFKANLIERRIAYLNGENRLKLTQSGEAFFNALFEKQRQDESVAEFE